MDSSFRQKPVAELVTGARAGSQPAWNELVERLSPLLWGIARRYRLTQSDAADVVQTTWLRLVENLQHIREPRAVARRLVTTCQREALRICDLNARCLPHDLTNPSGRLAQHADPDRCPEPPAVVLDREAAHVIRAALEDLPTRQRHVLVTLTQSESRTRYTETAQALSMPAGSIGPVRQRALRRLRANPNLQAIWKITDQDET